MFTYLHTVREAKISGSQIMQSAFLLTTRRSGIEIVCSQVPNGDELAHVPQAVFTLCQDDFAKTSRVAELASLQPIEKLSSFIIYH